VAREVMGMKAIQEKMYLTRCNKIN